MPASTALSNGQSHSHGHFLTVPAIHGQVWQGWHADATILVCLAVLPPLPADALTLLTAGKQATFYDRPGTGSDSARIEVRGEGALRGAPNPRSCAQAAALEIASYPVAQNLVVKNLVVPLPCAGCSEGLTTP